MDLILNPVIFYITSCLIIFFALLCLFMKNIIYALISAVFVFFLSAIIFFMLGSEYNAIIQAIIYGISVPVIIGISIMFTNRSDIKKKKNGYAIPYLSILGALIFAMSIVYVIMISLVIIPDTFRFAEISSPNYYNVMSAFAGGIFIKYVWAFELISLLLTIVIAGISMYTSKKGNI